MIRIRRLSEADLPLIRGWMRDSSDSPAWSDDDLQVIVRIPLSNESRIRRGWIAEEENAAARGFAVATALTIPGAPAECELEFLLVSPEARQRGVGCALVGAVLGWARKLRAEEIRLEVRASNMPALRLYEGCGFAVVGHRRGYYAHPTEDAVLMCHQAGYRPGNPPV